MNPNQPNYFDLGLRVEKREVIEMAQGWLGDIPLETTEIAWDELDSESVQLPKALQEVFKAITIAILASGLAGKIFFPDDLEARERWTTTKVADVFFSMMGGTGTNPEENLIRDEDHDAGYPDHEIVEGRMGMWKEQLIKMGTTPMMLVSLYHGVDEGKIDLLIDGLTSEEIIALLIHVTYLMAFEINEDRTP